MLSSNLLTHGIVPAILGSNVRMAVLQGTSEKSLKRKHCDIVDDPLPPPTALQPGPARTRCAPSRLFKGKSPLALASLGDDTVKHITYCVC